MKKINVVVIGCGNCASAFIQGLTYYKDVKDNDKFIPGLMNPILGGYKISDIEVVAGFDIDKRKIGKDISQAIFEKPNNTKKFSDVPFLDIEVMKGPVLDGVAEHMKHFFQVDENQRELTKDEIISILKETQTQMIISYLPVGSQFATEFWAQVSLDSNVGFINCIPVFIASDPIWANRFKEKSIPLMGDDIKSQCGATILHRAIVNMLVSRGAKIYSTYQTNIGGNTDFANMISESRLTLKRISKTESVSSQIPYDIPIFAGPNGYIESLKDNKICDIRIDFGIFGDISCHLDCKLSVEDSPDSAGVVIDAIRCCRLALDRGIGGVLDSPCAYFYKHPPKQYTDDDARQLTENFINEKSIRG